MDNPFWKSHWLDGQPLSLRFPLLYKHSINKATSVRDALTDRGWVANIKRNPSRATLTEYLQLWALLESAAPTLLDDEEDKVIWRLTSSGKYTASSAYHALLYGHIPSQALHQVWNSKAIPKCRMHAWLLLRERCLTADNLAKRGWPHDPICKLCFIHPETAVHLAATCSYTTQVWSEVLQKVSLPAVLGPTTSTLNLQDWWLACSKLAPPNIVDRWRSVALLSWWMLWKERNNRIFNNKASPPAVLAEKIVTEISLWRIAGVLGSSWPESE